MRTSSRTLGRKSKEELGKEETLERWTYKRNNSTGTNHTQFLGRSRVTRFDRSGICIKGDRDLKDDGLCHDFRSECIQLVISGLLYSILEYLRSAMSKFLLYQQISDCVEDFTDMCDNKCNWQIYFTVFLVHVYCARRYIRNYVFSFSICNDDK